MNIALRPTQKIIRMIKSKDNYHSVINEIVKDVSKFDEKPTRTDAYIENTYHNGCLAFHLTPKECEEIMLSINKDKLSHGWGLEFTCFECSKSGLEIEVTCPHTVPLPCPKCTSNIDFSDLALHYEFYHDVYIKNIVLSEVRKVIKE